MTEPTNKDEQQKIEKASTGALQADPSKLSSAVVNDMVVMQEKIDAINTSLIGLGQYLRDAGCIDFDLEVEIPVTQIADVALSSLQSAAAKIAELTAMIEELTPEPETPVKKSKAVKIADDIDDDQFQKASTIMFADERGHHIAALPPITFTADKFEGSARGRMLNADIEFPVHGPAASVGAVYLVDAKGKPVSKSEMVMPLAVSGGRTARINAGSLLFPMPVKTQPKPKAKAA